MDGTVRQQRIRLAGGGMSMRDGAFKLRRLPGRARWMAAVTAVLLGLLLTATVQGQGKGLFSEVEPAAAARTRAPASTDATTLRRRVVTIDFGMLTRARAAASVLPRPPVHTKAESSRSSEGDAAPASDATLTLNLFRDVVFTGIVDSTAPTFSGGYSLSGRLAGQALGTLTLVVNGEVVAGTVRTLSGTYRIRSVGRGRYAISEVKELPLNCRVAEPHSGTDHQH